MTRGRISVEQFELRDRYSGAKYAIERWLVRGFIHIAMELYLKRFAVHADSRWNMARWWAYLPSGMRRWRHYIPGGIATSITYDPDALHVPSIVRLDGITKRFFRHSLDAVGLRTRAYLLMEVAVRQLEAGSRLKWVSLGAGTGHVAHEFLCTLSPALRARVHLTLVDKDAEALALGRQTTFRVRGVAYESVEANVTDRHELTPLLMGKPQLVDALGLVEYLSDDEVTVLVKRVYRALAPGGSFVISNMADDRPELRVHQRAVCWPGVIVRSPRRLLDSIRAAGVPADAVRCMRADDAIYYVYEVVKQ